MYALTPRCYLPPLRRSPHPCQAASMTSPLLLSIPSRADPDELRSTWPQRAWTLAGSAAILSSLSTSASLLAAGSGSAAALAAYSLADLATGVYHPFVDNYGDASTPVFGSQIAAFQGHHRYPSTITFREPCNKLHALARAVALLLLPVDAALSAAATPAAAHAFAGAFAACVVLSQQFHAWAHEKQRRPPACSCRARSTPRTTASRTTPTTASSAACGTGCWTGTGCSRRWRWWSTSAPASARGRGRKRTPRGRRTPELKPPPGPQPAMMVCYTQ